jgi:hypothetical protein
MCLQVRDDAMGTAESKRTTQKDQRTTLRAEKRSRTNESVELLQRVSVEVLVQRMDQAGQEEDEHTPDKCISANKETLLVGHAHFLTYTTLVLLKLCSCITVCIWRRAELRSPWLSKLCSCITVCIWRRAELRSPWLSKLCSCITVCIWRRAELRSPWLSKLYSCITVCIWRRAELRSPWLSKLSYRVHVIVTEQQVP